MTARYLRDELSDKALIRSFLEGDEEAFSTLYHRHTPRLRLLLARLLGDRRIETDDVIQETWVAGCRSMHGFNGSAQFSSWLATIGIRAVRRRFRIRDDEHHIDLTDQIAAPPIPATATVVDLERAIGRLPDHQRMVLVLHDVEGFTHDEIAERLGVATGTSKGTLSRARAAMRRMLSEGGGGGYD